MHRCPSILRVAAIAAALVAARAGASDCYTLTLRDSWGDGWNGAEWVFQANETFSEGTLDSGLVEEVSLCVASAPTCFAFEVRPGSYDSEISWDFDLVDVEGGAAPFARTEYWLLADGRVIESACDAEPLRPSAAPTYTRAPTHSVAPTASPPPSAAPTGVDTPVLSSGRLQGLVDAAGYASYGNATDVGCFDDPEYADYPYACRDWVGYDCANAAEDWNASVAEDWNAEDVAALLAACPRSCGTCDAFAYDDPFGASPVYALGAVVVFDDAVRVAATSVVVRGSNASVAVAGGATRLFEVTSGGALRLENLALRGGAPSLGDGGAVAVEGGSLLVLVDCVVSDSTAGGSTTTGGGGVAVEGVLFLFRTRIVASSTAGGAGGGVRVAESSHVVAVESSFRSCYSYGGEGGAVWIGAGSSGAFENCTFDDNDAGFLSGESIGYDRSGGAIAVMKSSALWIVDSTFTRNYAQYGGALWLSYDGSAGAEDAFGADVRARGCSFESNHAQLGGGHVAYADGPDWYDDWYEPDALDYLYRRRTHPLAHHAVFDDCEFRGGSAQSKGGAIRLGYQNYLELADSSLSGNACGNYGGALFTSHSQAVVERTRLDDNSAGYGGAILAADERSVVYLDGSTATGNYADVGGFMYFEGIGHALIGGGATISAAAAGEGGAFYVQGVDGLYEDYEYSTNAVSDVVVNASAAERGAAFFVGNNAALVLEGVTTVAGVAGGYGGSVYLDARADLSTVNFRSVGDEALAGVVYVGPDATWTGGNASFADASVGRGTVFVSSGILELRNATFGSCEASSSGATLYAEATAAGDVLLENVSVAASSGPGSVSLDRAGATLRRVRVVDAFSDDAGAGLAAVDASLAVLEAVEFRRGAARTGGAVAAEGGSRVVARDCVFAENGADHGGVAALFGGSTFESAGGNRFVRGAVATISTPSRASPSTAPSRSTKRRS